MNFKFYPEYARFKPSSFKKKQRKDFLRNYFPYLRFGSLFVFLLLNHDFLGRKNGFRQPHFISPLHPAQARWYTTKGSFAKVPKFACNFLTALDKKSKSSLILQRAGFNRYELNGTSNAIHWKLNVVLNLLWLPPSNICSPTKAFALSRPRDWLLSFLQLNLQVWFSVFHVVSSSS